MTRLDQKEFIVVSGKGGTGRTTTSMVIGAYLAGKNKKTLLCLANALPRNVDLLGDGNVGPEISAVSPCLDVVNLQPRESREEYGRKVLPSRTLHRMVFRSKTVGSFLDAVPGLAEWAMLGKATHHALNRQGGNKEYDVVIFDSPATGHGLDILALPRAIVKAVPTGRMREEALERRLLLEDRDRSEILPVTLPEEMPVNETAEFTRALPAIRMAAERLVVNRVISSPPNEALTDLVDTNEDPHQPWLLPAAVALSRYRSQTRNIDQLNARIKVPQIHLPEIKGGLTKEGLERLTEAFEKGLDGNETERTQGTHGERE